METTIIALENTHVGNDNKQQMMTSLEIAELTGKMHKDVMKAIRNMEPAWEKVQGRKFALLQRT
ncbi:MAG: Rha family transcriptional regulator, partial [Bacteroidaceae bacterium]|nr:Rha family transcriptional regulator [Bacteroidaceae bacterium]